MNSLEEAGRYFMGESRVQKAAIDLASALEEAEVPYVIAGGLAVTLHGHERATSGVDVLLTTDGLRRFKERWLDHGWVKRGSKGMLDIQNNVKIYVLITGQYPGDGKPKPIRFPDPEDVAVKIDDLQVLDLPDLIELKLASGMTLPDRPRDFDDVIQLIRQNGLGKEFADWLNLWVQDKYAELWGYAQIPTDDY